MNAIITHIAEERPSGYKGTYFIIKVRTKDGEKYDIVPSSDCSTYQQWLKIADSGIGTMLFNLKIGVKRNSRQFCDKRILPTNIKKLWV